MKESKYSSFRTVLPVQNCYLIGEVISSFINNYGAQVRDRDNRKYQKERNDIEDARYEEELGYNRAWAEDQRDYERALQQQQWEREDTSLLREASQLSELGINPLTQNMSGSDSSIVSNTAPAQTTPAHSGTAFKGDAQYQLNLHDELEAVAPFMEILNGVNNLNTQGLQRDSIHEQINLQKADVISKNLANESQMLANLEKAKKLDATKDENGNWTIPDFKHTEQDFNILDYENQEASKNRNVREDKFQEQFGSHDNNSKYEQILTDFENQVASGRSLGTIIKTMKESNNPALKAFGSVADLSLKAMDSIGKRDKGKKRRSFSQWWKDMTMSPEDMEQAYSNR